MSTCEVGDEKLPEATEQTASRVSELPASLPLIVAQPLARCADQSGFRPPSCWLSCFLAVTFEVITQRATGRDLDAVWLDPSALSVQVNYKSILPRPPEFPVKRKLRPSVFSTMIGILSRDSLRSARSGEIIDHLIVLGEAHLRRIVVEFAAYYNGARIHHSLGKDAPFHRAIERVGSITSRPLLGGLHHQYCRI